MTTLYIGSNNIGTFSEDSNAFQQPYHLCQNSQCIVCVPAGTTVPEAIASKALKVVYTDFSIRPSSFFQASSWAATFFKTHGLPAVDCVVSDFSESSLLIARRIKAAYRIPWYVILWDVPFSNRYDINKGLRYKIEKSVRRIVYNRTVGPVDTVFCFINKGCLQAEGIRFREVVQLVNGVDENLIASVKQHRFTKKPNSICVVGRIRRDKGSLNILKALEAIAPEYPDLSLTFVGQLDSTAEGRSRAEVEEALERHPLRSQITITGRQPFMDAMKVVDEHEVGLHAYSNSRYLYWNQVLKVGEYQALGVVPVAVRYPGTADLITDGTNGILMDSNDPQEIALALRRLFGNRAELERLAGNASDVLKVRSWKIVTDQLFGLISSKNVNHEH